MRITHQTKLSDEERSKNIERVERARLAFEDLIDYYQMRERSFRYYSGDQWSDTIEDPDSEAGKTITEEELIKRDGRLPAKQNLIGKTVRNLAGQFRTNYPDPVAFARTRNNAKAGEMMTNALQYALDLNEANELDAENMREYGVSGACGWKIGFQWLSEFDRKDLVIDNINMTRFFYNVDARDIRGKDVTICGEVHDLTIHEIISRFGLSYKKDFKRVQAMFPGATSRDWDTHKYPEHVKSHRDFYIADNPNKVRLIEVWLKEYDQQYFLHDRKNGTYKQVDKEYFIEQGYDKELVDNYSLEEIVQLLNTSRFEEAVAQGVEISEEEYEKKYSLNLDDQYEEVWNVYYLSPNGDLLLGMRTPYEHQTHPYVFGRYMMDGKIMSMVDNLIDQQRHINRIISMIDAWIGKSLKNVMMIAEESVPSKYKGKLQEYSNDMVKMNGFVFYKAGTDGQFPMPKEISSKAMPAGSLELLNIQSELIKDLSAVNDAVQGKAPNAGTPASLYAQQTINASITNKDIFDFYFSMIRKRNRKVVQVIKQFYDEQRFIKVSGTGSNQGVEGMYDPEEVADIDFDVVIGESQNTLAYRQTMDTELREFLANQLITFQEYLELSNQPYADKVLQMIGNRNTQDQAMLQQGMVSPDEQGMPGQPQFNPTIQYGN